MTRQERIRDIGIICGKCGCNEKQRERHFKMFVDEEYQPHASLRFKDWWFKQPEFHLSVDENGNGISPVVAQNVARIWDTYMEAKELGLA